MLVRGQRYEEASRLGVECASIAGRRLGSDPQLSGEILQLGDAIWRNGEIGEAQRVYEALLPLTDALDPGTEPRVASVVSRIADCEMGLGRAYRAQHQIAETLEQRGLPRDDEARLLCELARIRRWMGDLQGAEDALQQSFRKRAKEPDTGLIITLSELADLQVERRQLSGATNLLATARRWTVADPDEQAAIRRRAAQAALMAATGRYADAEVLLESMIAEQETRVREVRASVGDGDEAAVDGDYSRYRLIIRTYASLLAQLGRLRLAMAEYAGAEAVLEHAASLQREVYGPKHLEYAATLTALASCAAGTGRGLSRAETLAREALELRHTVLPGRTPAIAESLLCLGALRRAAGDPGSAEAFFTEAQQIVTQAVGEDHPSVATALHQLAGIRADSDPDAARELYQRAGELRGRVLGPEHPAVADSLEALAELAPDSEAEALYRRALRIWQQAIGRGHPGVVRALRGLALALATRLSGCSGAQALLEEALAIRRRVAGDNHPATAEILDDLASVLAAQELFQDALKHASRRAEIDDLLIGPQLHVASEAERAELLQALDIQLNKFLSVIIPSLLGDPSAVGAALDIVLRRKALVPEGFAYVDPSSLLLSNPDHAADLGQLAEHVEALGEDARSVPRTDLGDRLRRVAFYHDRRNQLEQRLAEEVPAIARWYRLRTADRQVVAAGLPEGSILVEYVRHVRHDFRAALKQTAPRGTSRASYFAFLLPARAPDNVTAIELGDADEIDALVADYAAAATRQLGATTQARAEGAPGLHLADVGSRLRAKLFEPLRGALGQCRHIVVSPASELRRVPFAALPVDGGKYLLDDYHVSYLRSGRDVGMFARSPKRRGSDGLVVGDPDFDLGAVGDERSGLAPGRRSRDLSAHGRFTRLRDTEREAEGVAAFLGTSAWTRSLASETPVKRGDGPRFLHLAVPGFFLPDQYVPGAASVRHASSNPVENPLLRAGLAMAGANTALRGKLPPGDAGDGLLTAEEVARIDLSGTELVVLSACTTRLGNERTGQSVSALQTAFVAAGARTLVMSLWRHPDPDVVTLVADFYRRTLEGRTRAEALREAQLEMRRKHPDPAIWGSFICVGDVSPLPAAYGPFVEARNPYVAGRPAKGEIFVGRRDILQKILDNVEEGAGNNILVLRGQRRTGKTSVLMRLQDEALPPKYIPVFVDIQAAATIRTNEQFLRWLATQLARGLRKVGIEINVPPAIAFRENPAVALDEFVDEVGQRIGDRQVLLMWDEFDGVGDMIDKGTVKQEVLQVIRNLMQHSPLLFLVAGTERLAEFTASYWTVFFNLTVPVPIGVLKESDARWLITHPVSRWYELAPDAVDHIITLTGCHPYFVQLVCNTLVDVRNDHRVNTVTLEHVDEAVMRALGSGGDNIGYPWTSDRRADERLVLSALAKHDSPGGPGVSPTVLEEAIMDAGGRISVHEVVERLVRSGVVRVDAGSVHFVVPLFQRWLEVRGYNSIAAASSYNAFANAQP